jgi:hypothetical protein
MRKGARFTNAKFERWAAEGRGQGTYADYRPWHQVTRADPGSTGLSSVIYVPWLKRQVHLLSLKEQISFLFSRMVPNLVDLREQFPLAIDDAPHELTAYDIRHFGKNFQGTQSIAHSLGFKHPMLRAEGGVSPWTMTTDLLLTIKINGGYQLLAVNCKAEKYLKKRTKQLIQIEANYWAQRGAKLLLITPNSYDESASLNLRAYSPWGNDPKVIPDKGVIHKLLADIDGLALADAIRKLMTSLNLTCLAAQDVFWSAVWHGLIPVDLRRRVSPRTPINLLSLREFLDINPIASGRSECFL